MYFSDFLFFMSDSSNFRGSILHNLTSLKHFFANGRHFLSILLNKVCIFSELKACSYKCSDLIDGWDVDGCDDDLSEEEPRMNQAMYARGGGASGGSGSCPGSLDDCIALCPAHPVGG